MNSETDNNAHSNDFGCFCNFPTSAVAQSIERIAFRQKVIRSIAALAVSLPIGCAPLKISMQYV